MFHQKDHVTATCDNCESELMSVDGHFEFASAEEAVAEARKAGWNCGVLLPGRLYCPDCAARHHQVDWS